MKKVLSVLLAAAMVMGMSVSVAADKIWGKGPEATEGTTSVTNLTFMDDMRVIYKDGSDNVWVDLKETKEDEFVFHPGDVAYFKIMEKSWEETNCTYTHEHEDGCYEWICTSALEENNHVHVEECYKPTKELTCNEHTEHTGECYKEVKEEICGGLHEAHDFVECGGCLNESHNHNHGAMEGKYFETGSCIPACGKEIHKEHDEKECYKITNELICEKELHVHDDVKCYTVDNGEPICGKVNHVCTDDKEDCTLMRGNLICGLDKEKDHKCDEECLKTEIVTGERPYVGPIDKDWAIYIKDASSYIKSAEFAVSPEDAEKEYDITDTCYKWVKITFQDSFDDLDIDDVDFYFYIADTSKNYAVKKDISDKAQVHYLFDNWLVKYVDFDFMNDVDFMTKWVTKEGKAGKGTASFNFNKEAYVVVKMNPEEEVIFNYSSAYDKALDKLAGYDADLSFYNFKGTKDSFNRVADLVIPADDESFIYAVVDGKFAEVEATYAEDYEVIKGTKVDGWVIETNELGYYVVSDIELEIEAEEVEAEPEVEAEKANPETGAADFVGAAVAMAVVSVAAAGALALKK